jgi:Domain of unknown function (DUF1877)
MGCLGVHLALSAAEVQHLRSLPSDRDRLDYMVADLEESYFAHHEEYLAQSDKAWDAMHRALADGELSWDGGDYPLNHVVLAGELVYTEPDYIASLKSPDQVRDIAAALRGFTEAEFRRRYFAIDPEVYGFPVSEQDFGYTWDWFQEVRRLYVRAAADGRYVLFLASQ